MTVVHDSDESPCQYWATRAISIGDRTEVQRHLPSRVVTSVSSAHCALAQSLVSSEMGGIGEPRAGLAAAERVFNKLSLRLSQLITSVGTEALLRRAVHLSRSAFPFLDNLESAAPGPTPLLELLLRTAESGAEPAEADQALVRVLGTLIALLESFIGKDLTFRLLRDIWPDVSLNPPIEPDVQT